MVTDLARLILKPKHSSKNLVNTMAADAMAPCAAKWSVTTVWTIQVKRMIVFRDGWL